MLAREFRARPGFHLTEVWKQYIPSQYCALRWARRVHYSAASRAVELRRLVARSYVAGRRSSQRQIVRAGANERTALARGWLNHSNSYIVGAQVSEIEMPDKYLRLLTKTNRRSVIGRSPSAAAYLMLLSLLVPNFVAAQSPQKTEPVEVRDANSVKVATLIVPRSSIQTSEIAVLINDNDPQSVEVASYYQQVRKIPSRNMIYLNFDQNKIHPGLPSNNGIDPAEFAALKAQVDAAAGPEIQALVVSWSKPFRIARFNYYSTNYSITSAFTFGIDAASPHQQQLCCDACEPVFRIGFDSPVHGLRYPTNDDARRRKHGECKGNYRQRINGRQKPSWRERLVC